MKIIIIRGHTKIFNRKVKLNWKIDLTKEKTNQKNDGQIKKSKQYKLWLNDKILTKGPRK